MSYNLVILCLITMEGMGSIIISMSFYLFKKRMLYISRKNILDTIETRRWGNVKFEIWWDPLEFKGLQLSKIKIKNIECKFNKSRNNDKLQFTHLWFGRNLSYLLMVWSLTLYPLKVRSIRFLQLTFVKNRAKYVILFHFYVSLLQIHRKHKNTR